MDDLSFSDKVIFQTLRELDFINQWLGGNAVTLNALHKIFKSISRDKSITIIDLGCGSGEMLRLISKKAISEKRSVVLTGIDANPHVIDYAIAHSRNENIAFKAQNILSDEFKSQSFDIIIATLFLHHFTNEQLVEIFASLKNQARVAVVVNDIHRHPLAYYSIQWLTLLFSKSSMVKYDAPLSVLRAFKKNELKEILQKAGIDHYVLKWKWAFRWQLIIHAE
ncbi:MAG TPA: SAM-dependent methyltransferase [Cytophagales bacterium]|nr:SAM-dependent methyltransferase [Cytophagales bacterium]